MSVGTGVVLGVDGGGTKTEAIVADLTGDVLGTGRSGGSNWEIVGREAAAAEIGTAVDGALAAARRRRADVVSAAFGLAGIDWPADVAPMRDALARLHLPGLAIVENDSLIALRAGAPSGWGIVSNVGTGTVTAGRDASGRWFRTMAVGWGEPSGASSLAREAVHAIAAAHHGTGPDTALTERVVERLGRASVLDLFESISRQHLRVGPDLAPLVDEVARAGDTVAIELIRSSGRRHGEMVVGVARRLALTSDRFELVRCGSRHLHATPFFDEAFVAAVAADCPHAEAIMFDGRPATGAVLLALDAIG